MEEWEEVRNASKCTDGCFFEQWAGESRAVPGDTRNVLKWNALTNNDRQWQICNKSVAKSANLLARCPSLLQYVWQHRYLKTPLIHVDSCILPFQGLRKGNFLCLAFLRWQLDTLTMFDYLWLSLTWKFLVPGAGTLLHQCTMSTSIQAQGLWDRTQDLAVWHRPATVRTCLNTLPYCVAGPRTGMMLKTNRSK